MTLTEIFRTDVKQRIEESWGQTGEAYNSQSKNI